MRGNIALVSLATVALAGPLLAGEKFKSTWWNGVEYNYKLARFEEAKPLAGRPALVRSTTWQSEQTPRGTVVRFGTGYLTADEKGIVHIAKEPAAGSYWELREVESLSDSYDGREDWKGTWTRKTFHMVSLAPALRGARVDFRDGQLVAHAKNKGLPLLAETVIDAKEISGK